MYTYAQNTPIHDELAYDMYKELKECGQHARQYRKSIALVAAMRLKRHQPDESLEILSIYDDLDVNIRYVRILSYTFLTQFEEVFRLLEMTIAPTHTDKIIKIPDQLVSKILICHQQCCNNLLNSSSFVAPENRTNAQENRQ